MIILDIDTISKPKKLLKKIFLQIELPVIYITSNIKKELKEDLYNFSCYGYISKDSDNFIISSTIKIALNLFKVSQRKKDVYNLFHKAEMISKFGYWKLDLKDKTVKGSYGTKKIYGLSGDCYPLKVVQKIALPSYRETLDSSLKNLIENNQPYNIEYKIQNNGKILSVHSIAEYDPEKNRILGTLYDISKQKKAEEAAIRKEKEYKNLIQKHSSIMLIINSETGDIILANSATSKFYGWNQDEIQKMNIYDINILSRDEIKAEMKNTQSLNKSFFSFQHKLSDGRIKDVEVHSGPIIFDGKKRLFSIIHDVTEHKKTKDKIQHLAYYDLLTELPNRKMFSKNLKNLISNNNNNNITLLNIDLDHFKDVNDSFGHHIGDLFLTKISKCLKENLYKNEILYRLGGDEFAIIIQKCSDHKEIAKICNRVLKTLDNSFKIEDKEIFISASIGVAIYPHDGLDVNTLFKNSDLAMYKAKNEGKNKYRLFSEEMNQNLKNRINLEDNMRKALKNNQFELYYQPKIDIKTNKIIGTASLIRWKNDEGNYISPSDFIPVAETSGLILEIDKWVFMEVCLQIKRWEKMGMKKQKVSVNISGLHFKRGRIINTITDLSNLIQIPSDQIEIEITEGVFLEKIEDVIPILKKLRAMGISISIDDFGTGYSSLSYLKRLPINRIKIDKSFVDNIVNNKKDRAIVQTIIIMTELLDLNVIAEGVESLEQIEILNQIGCYEIQGFYFAKPMPVREYNKFFKQYK